MFSEEVTEDQFVQLHDPTRQGLRLNDLNVVACDQIDETVRMPAVHPGDGGSADFSSDWNPSPPNLLQHLLPGPFIMRWIAIFLPLVVATTAKATERFEFLIDKTLDPIEVALATTHRLAIRIEDKVTGGCWQNPNAVGALVEQQLRSKGFEVVDQGGIDGILRIRGLGRLITVGDQEIGCVVIFNSSLKNAGLISIPLAAQGSPPVVRFNYQNYESWESLHHILETKGAMENVVKRTAELHVQALMNQIFRARTKIFSAHPEIESRFQARISNEP